MSLKQSLVIIFLLAGVLPLIMSTEGCTIKNVTYKEIKTSHGYKFPIEPGNKSKPVVESEISLNQTVIAEWKDGKWNYLSAFVHSCDNKSITTHNYGRIQMKFIYDEGGKISDSCQIFNITDMNCEHEDPVVSYPQLIRTDCPTGCILLAIFFAAALLLVLSGIMIRWDFIKQKKKGRVRKFTDYVRLRCCCNDKGNSDGQVEQRREELLIVEENCRNFREEQEQQQQLLNGKSDNTESKSQTTDFSFQDETLLKDDAKRQVNGVFPLKPLNGNMGHDPGGGKADTKLHCNRNLTEPEGEPSFNCTMDDRRLSTCKQGSAREEAADEMPGDKGQTLVDSLGQGINGNEPPNGDKDAHYKARVMLNK